MTPIRGWSYEFFVIQHVVSFALLLAFAYIHTPVEMNAYIWIPVALFFFDRLFRAARAAYANLSIFHPSQKKQGQMRGFWACKAKLTPLPHDTTRIVIENPPISWAPGQHVFLSCHSIVPLQSHPFTIASIPEDGRMEFIVKAEKGGTRRFFRHAEKAHASTETPTRTRTVAIEGPYGCLRPLRQFDSVVLFAGSTGATFTFPLLRDIIQAWRETASGVAQNSTSFFGRQSGAATRHMRFVWVIKSRGQLEYFSEQLSSICAEFQTLQERLRDIKLELTVYVTCDDSFTEEHKSLLSTLAAPGATSSKNNEHGAVQYRGRGQSDQLANKTDAEKEMVREVMSIESDDQDKPRGACGPDGTCCCRTTVDENTTADTIAPCCCCASTSRPASGVSSTPPASIKRQPVLHPSITVFSGRPKTKEIIRRSLEQALGESAVVVCGPQGLVTDVKQDVCSLSDERAVHKGTGAQGIYLHTESFSY